MKTTLSTTKAAEELLEKVGKPMHYKEITKAIMPLCNLHGKTPHETVRSLMGTSPKFIRVAEGVYALSKWKKYKPARFAKDIAYEILQASGEPMSLQALGLRVFEERQFRGHPSMVVRNVLHHDTRFVFDKKTKLVSLVEWQNHCAEKRN